jgi:predicted DNA-binding transcriptional regulator AlpA
MFRGSNTETPKMLQPPPAISEISPQRDIGEYRAEKLRDAFEMLSPADLAALIGVDERTLAVWRAGLRPRGPDFVKLGRAVFYRRADVNAWIALNVTSTDRVA